MAAIVGSTGPLTSTTGSVELAWPAGSAAGQLAVAIVEDRVAPSTAWNSEAPGIYSKRVTAGDLSAPLTVQSSIGALIVCSASGGVGVGRDSYRCTTQAGEIALWFGWMSPRYSGAIAAATYRRGSEVSDPEDGWKHALFARETASAGTYDPGSVNSRSSWTSLVILSQSAPLPPTWLSPTSGSAVDRTAVTVLSFDHNSSAGLTMDQCRVQIRPVGGSWSYVAADGTLSGTSVDLTQSVGSVSIAAAQLTANTTYEVQALTHDAGGWSSATGTLTIVARTPPTLTVSLATAAGDMTPTVTVTPTLGYGAQQSLEVRLTRSTDTHESALVDSGLIVGAETSWTPTAAEVLDADGVLQWVNGGQIKAWARIRDAALPSAWTASTAQTTSWTAPPAPSAITVTDGTPLAVGVSGIPAASVGLSFEVETSTDVWEALASRTGDVGTMSLPVPLAPYDAARRYRVRSWESVDGVWLPSAWVTSSAVASTDRDAYLVAVDGSAYLAAGVFEDGPRVPVQGRTASIGLGATRARIDVTESAGWRGSMSIDVETEAEHDALVEWLTTREAWIVRWPVERTLSGEWAARADTRMGLPQGLQSSRWDQLAITPRNVAFDWIEQ